MAPRFVLPNPPILVITDRTQARAPLPDIIAACAAGGLRWVSLREKDLDGPARARLFDAVANALRHHEVRLSVHGDAALAAAARVPLHLGAVDPTPPAGSVPAWGRSCHDAASLRRAADEGAGWATLSPVWLTDSKPGYGPALGLEGFRALAATVAPLPVLALGGVTPAGAAELARAGAAGCAVMGTLMRAADPASVAAAFVAAWREGAASRPPPPA